MGNRRVVGRRRCERRGGEPEMRDGVVVLPARVREKLRVEGSASATPELFLERPQPPN